MGSRVRHDPDHLFEVFLELAKPSSPEEDQLVLQVFPETYNDQEVLKSVPKFAFPYMSYQTSAGEHFTFVLTDLESRFKFGFCRLSPQTQTCLCIISWLPWYEIFFPLLDHLSRELSRTSDRFPVSFLNALYTVGSFKPGETVVAAVVSTNEKYSFVCPVQSHLPSLPENHNLNEFCSCLDINNMMAIFANMLYERRILFVGKSLDRLTSCLPGAVLLLYPMNWQHLYIPVLPPHLLDYCSAPMPYLIGLHSSVMTKIRISELGDAVIVNVDNNVVTSQYDDLSTLPEDVVSSLKRHLKQLDKGHSGCFTGDSVPRAFLKAMVALIGGYRDGLRFRPGELITFDPEAFVISRPPSMQSFLRNILQLQTFQQFISDRLDMLNAGEGFKDDFDVEATMYSDKWGSNSRYKDWLNHMKKQGKKLKREGKDKWFDFTSMMKDKSKKTFKDLKSRIDDIKKDEIVTGTPVHSSRPSPVYGQPHRPPRPPPPNLSRALGPVPTPRQSMVRRKSSERIQRYYPILDDSNVLSDPVQRKIDRVSIDDAELGFNPLRRVNTDLLTDPDIQRAFRKSYSVEDLAIGGDDDDDENGPVAWDRLSENVTIANPLDMNSRISLDSKSSGSAAGTGSLVSDLSDVSRPPADRSSFNARGAATTGGGGYPNSSKTESEETDDDRLLINLDTTSSSNSFNSLDNIEFDPLKSRNNNSGNESGGINDRKTMTEEERTSRPMIDGNCVRISAPVPKPRPSRAAAKAALVSHPAAVAAESPVVRRNVPSPDTQSIREARAAFMQAEASKPPMIAQRQESLDQFDPLATGQLVLDAPRNEASERSMAEDEDDLLKEWNLDFDRMKVSSGRGGGGTSLNVPATSTFSSMPNLLPTNRLPYYPPMRSGYLHGYPSSVVQAPVVGGQPWPSGSSIVHNARHGLMNTRSLSTMMPMHLPNDASQLLPNPDIFLPTRNDDVAGKSSTLPPNSSLAANSFGPTNASTSQSPINTKSQASLLQSNHATFMDGQRNQLASSSLSLGQQQRPLTRPLSAVDMTSMNNNHQWEKFE